MNKLYVALNLIRLLNENRYVTSNIVADEFGVSVRTAQRYLNEMTYLPGVCCDEENHRWYLTDKYGLHDSYLKSDELAVLSGIFDYAESLLQSEYSDMLRKIKKKIITASNKENVVSFLKTDTVEFEKIASVFSEIESCILNKLEISFLYSKNDETYTVKPYRLIYSDGFWYMAGAKEKGEIRKFALDLIKNIRTTGVTFDDVAQGVGEEIQGAKSIFFDPHKKIKVECLMQSKLAGFLKRKSSFPYQEIMEEKENGDIVFSFQAGSPLECVKLCLEWIPHIKILSPHIVRDYFVDMLDSAKELNG
jgi:predicted DNA-binding transcriptional regulator YafY